MIDPNVRRLITAARNAVQNAHFAFLSAPEGRGQIARQVTSLFDRDLRRLGVRTIRFPLRRSGERFAHLPRLLDLVRDSHLNFKGAWHQLFPAS